MSKLLNIDINEQLLEILDQFDMKLEQVEDYYFVDGIFPGIVAQAFEMEQFENSVVVQVDIHILLPNQSFVESFVGHSSTVEEAIADCFEQFEVNILHTLIMAFWDKAKKVENGVGSDIWEINGNSWQVIISNYGYRGEQPIEEIVTDSMFAEIEKMIKSMPLDKDIYAVRAVQTNIGDGKQITEALINNEESPVLEKAISALDWKNIDSYYTVRNFVLIMKLNPTT
ncbi:hypothetical protein GSY74_01505 [Sulfurovum sp. bin170]|uniref:DUF6348 family protein n=1 Tax=Sulfurovum sp. bin170 TaxID=2695268 RepID=UPI0013E0E7AD|nr:DUF6348 family protein [Sulfurovum sp. bin170]NEW59946.1 hypothetical protein [Sulfurovum sp. bin170]